jgi:AcrR family transcriptional regulator
VLNDQRKYQLRARAERQRATRERIVAATAALHSEVGPARTTIADVARRAGVQRLTVYNHFPRLRDLLGACQSHFLSQSPPPDPAPGLPPGSARRAVLDRLEAALAAFYGWYRANEALERQVHRDRHLVPDLDDLMRAGDLRLEAAAAAYSELLGGPPETAASVRRLVRLALDFRTWELLAAEGASDGEVAALLREAVAAAMRRATSAATERASSPTPPTK